jgi:predicted nucleic acid-binding protein
VLTPEEYLIDTSAHARIWQPPLREQWNAELLAGTVALCAPTEIEILSSARSLQEFEQSAEHLRGLYRRVPVPDDVWPELRDLHADLARIGCHHSVGVVDLLVALTARHHRLTVLHYHHGFETIAKHTEITTRWLAEPGSID